MTFMPAHPHDIPHLSAQAVSRAIHQKQVSCREVMAATLTQVDRLNPGSHAIVSRVAHDVLAIPVAQVWPFNVNSRWPQSVAGQAMKTHHR